MSILTQLLNSPYKIESVKELPINSPIDLEFTIRNTETNEIIPTFVEVKTRNKNERQLAEYPWAELKMERLQKMRNYQYRIPNSTLFYAVILNNKDFYLYNLLSLDYSKINLVNWEVKKTEFDPNSEKQTYQILQLPFELALHANIIQTPEKEKNQKLF